eukprot:TRINITY_DN7112_c0_g1_i1.p1 TRINITY_DN7112_c0_g1~~TRINITY_DN7112_c0_g1_i1.p1  ORF type:complete len:1215 (-),score=179.41 TRINITY_DN7112_c0_g1_i1:162-3806(-)
MKRQQTQQHIVQADEDLAEDSERIEHVEILQDSGYRDMIYAVMMLISGGIVSLISRWYPIHHIRLIKKRATIIDATWLILKHADGEIYSAQVYSIGSIASESDVSNAQPTFKYFTHRCRRYVFNPNELVFEKVTFTTNLSYKEIYDSYSRGIKTQKEYDTARQLHGSNIIEIPLKSNIGLLLDEVLHPFFVFQLFSIGLWLLENYYIYAIAILVISSLSAISSLVQTKRNILALKEMAEFECEIKVQRFGEPFVVSSGSLVPGDIIELQNNMKVPCDLILMNGECIMNESSLTGESIPVLKSSLPFVENEVNPKLYNFEEDTKYTLYAGTIVIQTRYYVGSPVKALVIKSGYATAKGKLVSSILFPKPTSFKFYEDSFKFVAFLFCIAILGFFYSLFYLLREEIDVYVVLLRAGDLVTIVVPPALPVAMTIGTSFAIERLKKASISCISPNRINVCGKIDMVCFDKTGTLTEEGLDVLGAVDSQQRRFGAFVDDLTQSPPHLLHAMATCHSLTIVDGQIIGDPLDIKMFAATKWILQEPNEEQQFDTIIPTIIKSPENGTHAQFVEYGIIRRFDFSSSLQRMSVIAKDLERPGLHLFAKGSPEKISQLCIPETVPTDFNERLEEFTKEGYRVIALGYRALEKMTFLKAQKVSRSEVETGLTFAGLLVLQNRLKPTTKGVIEKLSRAKIKSVMVTGDNALTGISVARNCHIVSERIPVYLGDVVNIEDEWGANTAPYDVAVVGDVFQLNAKKTIIWKNVDHPGVYLHPLTLQPVPLSSNPTSQKYLSEHMSTPYSLCMTGTLFETLHQMKCLSITERDQGLLSQVIIETDAGPGVNKYGLLGTFQSESCVEEPQDNLDYTTIRLQVFEKALKSSRVFARMSPDHKAQLVGEYNSIGFCTAFCGDGANDCGALKAAQVGISLSEAEASIAAPLTSHIPTIDCVETTIREGRAALATSFQCFKFMALYSLVQFTSVLQMYTLGITLGDFQFLFIDLFLILPLAVTMGRTGAYEKLSSKQPTANLMSGVVLASIIGQTIIQFSFQVGTHIHATKQGFYKPTEPDGDPYALEGYDNTVIFLFSNFQYIIVAVAFSIVSKPFRQPFYRNTSFTVTIVLKWLLCLSVVLFPQASTQTLLQIVGLPLDFRLQIGALAFANLSASALLEILLSTFEGFDANKYESARCQWQQMTGKSEEKRRKETQMADHSQKSRKESHSASS